MSTFNGIVEEFPDIRIDYFRKIPDRMPPLACFLSHVHSDHLQGLETLKSPFIYCSPATRELLLRLEKYPHRMDFAKGVLETRKQHYKHLKNLLKTIPLSTPTEIELGPSKLIRVTLLDANHCAGAVMFLLEGDAKAVLYTGDIRSEPWWVNSLVRNPVVLPYTIGPKCLDKIYMDTTFAVDNSPYRNFPSKANGLKELLNKVSVYPTNTVFHFHAWTFGYEEVWVALAAALQSQIHVDQYKMGLYRSLTTASGDGAPAPEGSALCGFKCGNRVQLGCLTSDQNARLHSCEHGTACTGIESSSDVVWIKPIITRTQQGTDLPELGAGGGGGDLTQMHELELDDTTAAIELMKLCSKKIEDPEARSKTLHLISQALNSHNKAVSLDALGFRATDDTIRLDELTRILVKIADRKADGPMSDGSLSTGHQKGLGPTTGRVDSKQRSLPRTITFPYSRHSSYEELCCLVKAFKPLDVYPCTTDEETWHSGVSIEVLFGHLCSGKTFVHDREMMALEDRRLASRARKRSVEEADSNADEATASQRSEESYIHDDPDATLVDTESKVVHHQFLTELRENTDRPSKRQRTHSPSSTEKEGKNLCSTPRWSSDTSHERRVDAIKDLFEPAGAQIEVIELSDDSPQTSDYEEPSDIVLTEILDQNLREEVSAMALENGCSNVIGRDIVNTRGFRPSRSLYAQRVSDAMTRDEDDPLEAEVPKSKEFCREINRLGKLMPTADDGMCYDAFTLEKGEFVKARDLFVKWVEKCLANKECSDFSDDSNGEGKKPLRQTGHEASNDDREDPESTFSEEDDAEQSDTQISLADSEFESQEQVVSRAPDSVGKDTLERGKIRNRKEAYKAAQGLHYRWYDMTPISSGNAHTEEELEL